MSGRRASQRPEQGFALVPAIFVLVVLALLAVAATRISTRQSHTVVMALAEARALAAARTGVEWGAWRALNGSCSSGTLNLAEAALAGFTVSVTCSSGTYVEGSSTFNSYTVQATATIGTYGTPGYVRRIVSSTFTNGN